MPSWVVSAAHHNLLAIEEDQHPHLRSLPSHSQTKTDRRLSLLPPRPLPLLLLRPPPPATSLDQDEVLLAAVPLVVLEVVSVPQGTPRVPLLAAPTTLSRPVSCEVSRRSAA